MPNAGLVTGMQQGSPCPQRSLSSSWGDRLPTSRRDSSTWWSVLGGPYTEHTRAYLEVEVCHFGWRERLVMSLSPSPAVARNCFLHIIVSFLEIIFWKPLRGVNERVRTFVYFLMCAAKVFSKSMETKYGAPSHVCDTTIFSVASLAMLPFT